MEHPFDNALDTSETVREPRPRRKLSRLEKLALYGSAAALGVGAKPAQFRLRYVAKCRCALQRDVKETVIRFRAIGNRWTMLPTAQRLP